MEICGNDCVVPLVEGYGFSGSDYDYDSSDLGSDPISDSSESADQDAVSRNCSEASLTAKCREAQAADLPLRRAVIAEIFKLFLGLGGHETAMLPVDRSTLPALVRRLEKVLYQSASSMAEYSDLASLRDRLPQALLRLKRSGQPAGPHQNPANIEPVDQACFSEDITDLPAWATVDLDQLNCVDFFGEASGDKPSWRSCSPTDTTLPNPSVEPKRLRPDTFDDDARHENVVIFDRRLQQRPSQAWHNSEQDYHLRKVVIVQVMQMFVNDGPWVPLLPPSFKPMLPTFIRRLEAALYRQAASREEYCDVTTLPTRLHSIAQKLLQ